MTRFSGASVLYASLIFAKETKRHHSATIRTENSLRRAAIIGSGPNGLRAALQLIEDGYKVDIFEKNNELGGGARSAQLTLNGLTHDVCSSAHPFGPTSYSNVDIHPSLADQITWLKPPIQAAHPLAGTYGVSLFDDVERTADQLEHRRDRILWKQLFRGPVENFEDFSRTLLYFNSFRSLGPFRYALFMGACGLPINLVSKMFIGQDAKALIAGVAAHSFRPFNSIASSAVGLSLAAAAQCSGWPVVEGGTGELTNILVQHLIELGANIHRGIEIKSSKMLSGFDLLMFDTSPSQAAKILGNNLPAQSRARLQHFKHAPGVFVGHFAVEHGIPWKYEPAQRAGTVHLGGDFKSIARAEALINKGTLSERPFGLVSQQFIADRSRYKTDVVPVDAYIHVPNGHSEDASEILLSSIEAYAPGFRDRIIMQVFENTAQLESMNPNLRGGDVVGGENSVRQLLTRPTVSFNPYKLDSPNAYICSASTFPGAGAHGMCGLNATLNLDK